MSKRTLFLLIAALVIVVGAGYGYSRYTASQAEPTPEAVLPADLKTTIWASGKIVPAQWATLSTPIGGQVTEIAVVEGDTAQAGAILLRLDDSDLRANVRAAQAALAAAEAELARLKAGPRPAQLAAAEDDIRLAEAGLQSAQAAVSQAEAALANANAQLSQAEAGLLAAQAALRGAEASLQRLRNGPTEAEKETAFARLKQAENALKQAQTEYDKIAWAGEVALTPQALALEQATLEYRAAQATYRSVVSGPTAEDIAAAEAAVESARAGVAQAEANVQAAQAGVAQAQANVQAAQASVAQAEATLSAAQHRRDLLLEGASPEEIAVAEAAVQQAKAALDAARYALRKAVVIAPFAGVVGTIHVRLGEQTIPGQPLLTLGSLGRLQVETTDLRETDVTRIAVGQVVDITFDALPDVVLKGTVARIAPQSAAGQGGTNYTTIITFDDPNLPPELRWGMTAFVNIEVEE